MENRINESEADKILGLIQNLIDGESKIDRNKRAQKLISAFELLKEYFGTETCPCCGGEGGIPISDDPFERWMYKCKKCDGKGFVQTKVNG